MQESLLVFLDERQPFCAFDPRHDIRLGRAITCGGEFCANHIAGRSERVGIDVDRRLPIRSASARMAWMMRVTPVVMTMSEACAAETTQF